MITNHQKAIKLATIHIIIFLTLLLALWLASPIQIVLATDCLNNDDTLFRSIASGYWNDPSIWECSDNGSDWQVPDTQFPSSTNCTITLQNSHTIAVTEYVAVDQLIVEENALLSL